MVREWTQQQATGLWATALCFGAAVGTLFAFMREESWLAAGLMFLIVYGFGWLLERSWEEGRV